MQTEHERRFAEAGLDIKLDDAEELLGRLTDPEVEAVDAHRPEALPKLRAAVLALRPRIGGSDPLLVPEELLDQTEGTLSSLIAGLGAYLDDGNVEHLNPLARWTDELVASVPRWPGGPDLPTTDASEVAARFRRSAGQQLHNLEGDFDKVKEEITSFHADVEKATGDWGEQRTSLELQIRELTQTIEQQRGRLDTAIEGYQEQFSTAQERRSEEYRQQLSALEAQTGELIKNAEEGYERQIDAIRSRADDTATELQSELIKAKEIASFVGGANTGAGYGNEAKSQKEIADNLRWLAIGFGLAAAGLAVWAILHAQQSDDPSVTVVLAKALGSLIFAGLAGYVATQSGHHRLREEQARQRELDLLALPAIIATLPDDQKEEITGEVATKLFLTPVTGSAGKAEPTLTKESISLISLLLDAIRKS